MTKKIVLTLLNIFFIGLLIYALMLFKQTPKLNIEDIVNHSVLQSKVFDVKVEEITLESGHNALFLNENSAPLIALDFCFEKAGYAFDDVHKQGLAEMAAAILEYGAGNFDNREYHDLLEENAIELNFVVSNDAFIISMTTPKDNANIAFDILKDVLYHPHLKQEHIEIVRSQQLEAIKIEQEKPETILYRQFKKIFYGSHPLGRSALGNIEDVEKITQNDLKNFFATRFSKDNLLIAIAGDLNKEEAKNLLDNLFKDMKQNVSMDPLPSFDAQYQFEEQNVYRDMPQVIARFVAEGTKRLAKDFYALYIANEIFGGSGLNSRLNLIAREKEGLTYGAYTYLNVDKYAPSIEGSFATSKENYQKMLSILYQEWQKMADFGVSEAEFKAIQNNMLTSFNLRFMSLSDISSQLLYMQKEHLGLDFLQKRNEYVKNTTLDDVNQAAKKYFSVIPSILTIGNNFEQGEN